MRHGYRPNPHATRLATGKAMAVGHVLQVSARNEMLNPIFADFLAGASETYAREGYELKLSIVPDDEQEALYGSMAESGSVDGLIVNAMNVSDSRIDALNRVGLPFVIHGRSTAVRAPYSWLDVNNAGAFRKATRFLLESGHRRIALVNGFEKFDFAYRRRHGFREAHSELGVEPDPELMRSDEMTECFGYEATLELMGNSDPPTAFLVSSILIAIGTRRALQDLGLQMGVDVSIVTFDDDLSYLRNVGQRPAFTAVRSSVQRAGKRCAEMLLELVSRPDRAPLTELWDAEFIPGSSTGPGPYRSSSIRAGGKP